VSDFDFEPVRGLPDQLPKGERILWQGAPSWRDLAVNAFHARKVIVYFAILGVVQAAAQLASGSALDDALRPFLWLMPMGLAAAAILAALAYLSARTTVYTITDKRLVFRIGMALPITLNLPFRLVDQASLRLFANGTGDIPVVLHEGNKFAYLVLWPHAKRWEFARPQPMMRSVPDAEAVARLLAQALAASPSVRPAAAKTAVSLPPKAVAA
jgi:hypothetical protein